MSYCRFSSMNWQCDVYVYEDVSGGFTTHVATRRRILPVIPSLLCSKISSHITKLCISEYANNEIKYKSNTRKVIHNLFSEFASFWEKYIHDGTMSLIPFKKIGLPFDGEDFNDDTAGQCAARLETLKCLGYKVPQYAIDLLRDEEING